MSPQVSSVARRMNVARSASGDGWMPSASSFARTNASIGVRTHDFCFTDGTAGRAHRLIGPVLLSSRRLCSCGGLSGRDEQRTQ